MIKKLILTKKIYISDISTTTVAFFRKDEKMQMYNGVLYIHAKQDAVIHLHFFYRRSSHKSFKKFSLN